MTNMRGFAAAQRAYDNMTPPDDGPSQCADCDGSGYDQEGEYCATCEGSGYVNDDSALAASTNAPRRDRGRRRSISPNSVVGRFENR